MPLLDLVQSVGTLCFPRDHSSRRPEGSIGLKKSCGHKIACRWKRGVVHAVEDLRRAAVSFNVYSNISAAARRLMNGSRPWGFGGGGAGDSRVPEMAPHSIPMVM